MCATSGWWRFPVSSLVIVGSHLVLCHVNHYQYQTPTYLPTLLVTYLAYGCSGWGGGGDWHKSQSKEEVGVESRVLSLIVDVSSVAARSR